MLRRLLVVVMSGSLLFLGCSDSDSDGGSGACVVKKDGDIMLGAVLPYSGPLQFGDNWEQSVFLALDEINAAGGVDGKTFGLKACDSATDMQVSGPAVDELIADATVATLLGPAASSIVLGIAPKAKAGKTVLMSPSATSPEITGIDDDGFVFRTTASDAFQGRIAASIAEREGYHKVYLIHRNDAYGRGLAEAFKNDFNGSTEATEYDDTTLGYEQTAIAAAVAFDPDAIFLVAFVDDGAAVMAAANVADWTRQPKWLLSEGAKTSDFVDKVGNDAFLEGALGATPAGHESATFQTFKADFVAKWGEDPEVFAGNIYDAIYLFAIASAIATDPTSGEQIRDALAKTHSGTVVGPKAWADVMAAIASAGELDYDGVTGPVDFDQHGDVVSNFAEWTITNGKIETVGCWLPSVEPCP